VRPRATLDLRLASVAGGLTALFLLVGRWSPARLAGGQAPEIAMPRTWAAAGLVLLALLVPAGRIGRRPPGAGSVVGLLAVLFAWLLGATLYSPDPVGALPKAYEVLLLGAVVLALGRIARFVPARALSDALWRAMLVVTGALALVAAASVSTQGGRLAVLGGGPNVFGRNMGILALIALDRALRGRRAAVWGAVVVGAAMLTVLSGSRGATIATAAGALVLLWVARVPLRRIVAVALVVAAVVAVVLAHTEVGHRAVRYVQERIVVLTLQERYLSGREFLYQRGLALVAAHPVSGGGLASFRLLGLGVYPHNLFLELWCDGGVVAVGTFVAALAAAVASLRRRGWPDPLGSAVTAMFLVAAQVSGDLFDSRTLFVGLVLSAVAGGRRGRPDPGRGGRNRRTALGFVP